MIVRRTGISLLLLGVVLFFVAAVPLHAAEHHDDGDHHPCAACCALTFVLMHDADVAVLPAVSDDTFIREFPRTSFDTIILTIESPRGPPTTFA